MHAIDLITLGDELLLGIRQNAHLLWIGDQLARHGLVLRRNLVLPDDPAVIQHDFGKSWNTANIVITTGGLGPTGDDVTREAVAEALGLELVFDTSIETAIGERFAQLGQTITENSLKQCYKPEGAEILPNPHGTAPGLYLEHKGKVLIMLPGPASELRPIWRDAVIPRLRKAGVLAGQTPYLQLRTCGIGESLLETTLHPTLDNYPGLHIAYCAHQGLVDIRLSLSQNTRLPQQLYAAGEACRAQLGAHFVSYGAPSLASVVISRLKTLDRTLAVAESCTGGLLSHRLTEVPGASQVFAGGVICYSNQAKITMLDVPSALLERYGAVSTETAEALAQGAAQHFNTDYALSATGLAGPSSDADTPVGTVYIACFSPDSLRSHKLFHPAERSTVKAHAVTAALDELRRELCKV